MIKIKEQKIQILFILTLLMAYPLPQMAADLYLPSWPTMVKSLDTTNGLLQLSLTSYFCTMGIVQLIYGPLSDYFGRKPLLLLGLFIFLLSSLACAFTVTSAYELIACRIIQGLGAGCCFVLASAILSECFEGKQLARLISYSAMTYSMALIFSPFIGSYIQHYIGWRGNFLTMAIYALLLWVLCYFFIFETKQEKCHVSFSPILSCCKDYLSLFKEAYFMGNVGCLIFSYGVFSIVGPFLLLDTFHVSVIRYGNLLLLIGFCYFLGASINSHALKYFTVHYMIMLGLALMVVASVGLEFFYFLNLLNTSIVVISCCIGLFGIGFVYPNCFANALGALPEKSSYSSAFIGSAILMGVSLISGMVAHCYWDHAKCLSNAFLILTILSIL